MLLSPCFASQLKRVNFDGLYPPLEEWCGKPHACPCRLKNTAFSRNLQYAIQRMRKNLIKKLLDNRLGILYLSNVG